MSSWFGDGFTSLKGQLTNLAKVLAEEPQSTESGGESSQGAASESNDELDKKKVVSPEGSQKRRENNAVHGGSGWTDVQLVPPSESSFIYSANVPKEEQDVPTESREDQTSLIAALQERIEQLSQENELLSMNVASLGRAAAELEAQVAVSQDVNANLSTGLEELDIQHQRDIESVMVIRDEAQKENDILKVRNAELEEELKKLKTRDEEKEKDREKERDRDRELVRELEERDRELECLESENASLRETVRDLIKEQEETTKDTLATISEQDGEELEAMEKQIEQLKKDLAEALKIQQEKNKYIDELNERLVKLTSEKDSFKLNEEIFSQTSEDEKSDKDKIKALEKHITDLEEKITLISNAKTESEALIEHLESQLEKSEGSIMPSTSSEAQEKLNCLERENQMLHSKMGNLESRLLELSDQKDHFQRECDSKDRKMCQILLESNAAEQECKNELEKKEIMYNQLVEEYDYFKTQYEVKIKEKEVDLEKLSSQLEANNEIIVGNAINPELNEKLTLLEQENENLMAEVAKMKLENKDLSLKVQQLHGQIEKTGADLASSQNDYQTLSKQYELDTQSLERKLNELSQESQQYHIDKEVFNQKEIELKNQLKLREEEINTFKTFKQQSELNLKEKVASVETEYKNIVLGMKQKYETLKDQQAENEALSLRIDELTKSYEETIANKEKELTETKEKLSHLINEKEKMSTDLTCLQKEYDVLSLQKSQFNAVQYEKERETFLRKIESITEQNSSLLSDVVRLNAEHSALKNQLVLSHNEEVKNLQEIITSAQNELKTTKEELGAQCNELKSKLNVTETERDELFKNIQIKHNECIGFQTEVLRLSEILKCEQSKIESTVVEKAQLEIKCEKLSTLESEGEANKKEIAELTQEVKTLKEQLDNASDLIKEIKRTEAEGQSAEDTSSTKNVKCADGCDKTQEELNKLSWALHNEQVNSKTLQRQLLEVKEKFEKSEVQLRRLQVHLVEIEQNQSEEQAEMEQMKAKLDVAEERLRQSSTAFTSANIRANQQVESLTHQVQVLTETKEKLETELSNAEDSVLKQQAAVTNLQAVLHQFQLDKQRDVEFETERLRQKLKDSHEKYEQLTVEMKKTMDQMNEMKKGLEAASRLSEQLDKKSQVIETLKSEAIVLKEKLEKEKAKVNEIHSSVEGKVDRSLVKNLVVGYMLADDRSKAQVLRVLASVLELNSEERKKLALEPQSQKQQQSLSEAFIKFLEHESQPKPQLVLSVPPTPEGSASRRTSQSSNSSVLLTADTTSTLSHSPVIPPYTMRSNHSILKDLLKDSTAGGSNS